MAGGILGELSYALIQPSARAIGTIMADVIVEENHRDDVTITQHPVEGGAIITDHAFKRPSTVEIRGGFSNSTAGYVGYVQEQYQIFLALQLARRPFNVYTGKRQYKNMLVAGLSVVTDPHSEYTLMFTAILQEVILVSTQTAGTGTPTTAAGANGDQADAASTGGVANAGSVDGTSVGSQAFNGASNPGDYSSGGSFEPISPNSSDLGLIGNAGEGLDGLSPPPVASPGEIVANDGTVLNSGDGTQVPQDLTIFQAP